jgi:hypothetical protein
MNKKKYFGFDKKQFFASLVGNWEGQAKTWFKPNELGDTSPIKGSFKEILDGLFVQHEYEGTLVGNTMKGMAIYGFNELKQQFECAWMDSQHQNTEIMFSTGKTYKGKFSVLGNYSTQDLSQTWGWRTEIEINDTNNIFLRYYNISPQGEEYLGVEFDYKRISTK